MRRITPIEATISTALLSESLGFSLAEVMMMVVGSLLLSWAIDQLIGPSFEDEFEGWTRAIEHDHDNVRSDKHRSNGNGC